MAGKTVVIIKRSPTIDSSPPPSKVPKNTNRQSSISNASSKSSNRSLKSDEENSAIPPTSTPAVTATAPKSTTDKIPSPIDATLPHGSTKEPESPKPVASRTDDKRQEQHKKGEHNTEESTRNRHVENENSSSANVTYNNKHVTVNGHNNNNNNNNNIPEELSSVITSPNSEYWLARNPVADQVFITDVTVNLRTVTIRECKTEKGFFKERSNTKPSDIV